MFKGKNLLIGKYVVITYNNEWKTGRVVQGDGDFFLIEILSFGQPVMSLYNIGQMQQIDQIDDNKQVQFVFFRLKSELDEYVKRFEKISDESANIVPFVKK